MEEKDPFGKSKKELGAKMDFGKNRLGLVLNGFARALYAVGEVGTYGAKEYSPGSWAHVPDPINRYTDAMYRHLMDEARGEEYDPGSNLLHAAHAAWNALARLQKILEQEEEKEDMTLPILCIDFDGVIHSYKSGWKGIDVISDAPVSVEKYSLPIYSHSETSIDWLKELIKSEKFQVCIFSSRNRSAIGVQVMKEWLLKYGMTKVELDQIRFPIHKPAAFLTIDDRATTFTGRFFTAEELLSFEVWNKVEI